MLWLSLPCAGIQVCVLLTAGVSVQLRFGCCCWEQSLSRPRVWAGVSLLQDGNSLPYPWHRVSPRLLPLASMAVSCQSGTCCVLSEPKCPGSCGDSPEQAASTAHSAVQGCRLGERAVREGAALPSTTGCSVLWFPAKPPPAQGLFFPPPCECVCVAGQGQRMVKRLQSSDFQPLASSFAIRLRRAPTDMSSLCCFSPASVSALQLHPTAPHRDQPRQMPTAVSPSPAMGLMEHYSLSSH